MSVFMYRSCDS